MFIRIAFCFLVAQAMLVAAEPDSSLPDQESPEVAAGHSFHGEAFNEGPRQAAELIPGMAPIEFPTSAQDGQTQKFIEQGIAQLHGFWYLEAERSFRQASRIEPDLAIPYWGMALANANNPQRARGLIDEAMQRRSDHASPRERLYIEAANRFIAPEKKDDEKQSPDRDAKKKRTERYLSDLEKILNEHPEDIEAKALLALNLWSAERSGVKITSRHAVSALMSEIFAVNPMHPAHHYKIHLWDNSRPQNALESAAMCGPSSPGIAHMWHMPGHIYSRLKRYGDAAWQQEASARVDHAHMTRARLIPDQIHNYAHNNEWLIRNLLFLGRAHDALDQARNLVSLPRHPRYNTLEKRGSYQYGRQRLLQTLTQYELWEELIKESGGHYLPPTDDPDAQAEWLGWLAVAHLRSGQPQQGNRILRSLRRRRMNAQQKLFDLADAQAGEGNVAEAEEVDQSSENDDQQSDQSSDEKPASKKELEERVKQLQVAIARGAAAAAATREDGEAFTRHAENAKLDSLTRAQWMADAGDIPEAIKIAEKAVAGGKGQVRPLAVLVDLLWRSGEKKQAQERLESLRTLAGHADLNTPLLSKLTPIAEAAGIDGDWRIKPTPASDLGQRPPLDELGPFRWQPYQAESWGARTADGELVASEEFSGRPRLLIFYLGFGCLHCVEQLQAFSPKLDEFRAAGIDVVGISTESLEQLQQGIKNFDQKVEIPLLSDEDKHVFKLFRCWDDFEDQPLHGTFLIDAQGRVRWQDISYEPFTDADFVLDEAKRLLALPM